MKNVFIALVLLTTSAGAVFAVGSSPQIGQIIRQERRWERHHNRDRDRNRGVRYETRTVYKGHKVYRDTYRIEWKNGREKTKRVSHVRIG